MDNSLAFRVARLFFLVSITFVLVSFLILSLLICFWCGERTHIKIRRFIMHIWAKAVARSLRIKIRIDGPAPKPGRRGLFVISNHMGPLDILVLAVALPMAFVSRHDLAQWPFVGIMARSGGTIFANRKLRATTKALVQEIAYHMKHGDHVLVFPEGTSSNGDQLLPFKSSVFEAPLISGSLILPINLSYESMNGKPFDPQTRDIVCWYGDMEFVPYIWGLLGARNIGVHITFNPVIHSESTRKKTAVVAHDVIKEKFKPITGSKA